MPKKAVELGALEVKRLSEPGMHFVGGVAGLALEIGPSGNTGWILRIMVGNKRRKMGLGGFPSVSLAQARELAREAREKVSQGVDPIDQKKKARSLLKETQANDVTFKACAALHIAAHRASWTNSKHQKQWERTLEKYAFPVIGGMWVRDITIRHLEKILEPIWRTKSETANRVRGRIEAVLDSAIARGYRAGPNPAMRKGALDRLFPATGKISETKHFPAMPSKELPIFFDQLQRKSSVSTLALQFLILTVVRSHNVRHASWGEINFETKTWIIPGQARDGSEQRMKTGKEHRVPLSPAALALLAQLPKGAGIDLIFPSKDTLNALSDMAMSKLMKEMGANGVPHGFRSTFKDWATESTAFPREVIERALAHIVGDKTEQAYMRSDLFEQRIKLMDQWAVLCTTLPRADGKVVQMRAAN